MTHWVTVVRLNLIMLMGNATAREVALGNRSMYLKRAISGSIKFLMHKRDTYYSCLAADFKEFN